MMNEWVEHRFSAMGSPVHLVLRGREHDARWAEHEIARLEQRWSRFVPCSDIARCNRAAGRDAVVVPPETLNLIADACAWWRATDGWFDPTVLPEPQPAPGCAGIEIDSAAGTVAVPARVGLDLGGIRKGAAADHIAAGLAARGVRAACISLGGDVRAYGDGYRDGGHGWTIPVPDPLDPTRVKFQQTIDDGAIATGTNQIRRWLHDGREPHHLIDPTTGHPADTTLVAVIVADRSAARAEVLAKAAFVAGVERGAVLLARHRVEGWFVDSRELVGASH